MWEKVYVCDNKLRSFCFQATTFIYIEVQKKWQEKTFIIWRMAKINYRGMFSAFHYRESMLTPSKSETLSIHCLLLTVWTSVYFLRYMLCLLLIFVLRVLEAQNSNYRITTDKIWITFFQFIFFSFYPNSTSIYLK